MCVVVVVVAVVGFCFCWLGCRITGGGSHRCFSANSTSQTHFLTIPPLSKVSAFVTYAVGAGWLHGFLNGTCHSLVLRQLSCNRCVSLMGTAEGDNWRLTRLVGLHGGSNGSLDGSLLVVAAAGTCSWCMLSLLSLLRPIRACSTPVCRACLWECSSAPILPSVERDAAAPLLRAAAVGLGLAYACWVKTNPNLSLHACSLEPLPLPVGPLRELPWCPAPLGTHARPESDAGCSTVVDILCTVQSNS